MQPIVPVEALESVIKVKKYALSSIHDPLANFQSFLAYLLSKFVRASIDFARFLFCNCGFDCPVVIASDTSSPIQNYIVKES